MSKYSFMNLHRNPIFETRKVHFRNWSLEGAVNLTQQMYSTTLCGVSGYSRDPGFEEYVHLRDGLFPAEVIHLLETLGVDFRKETRLSCTKLENGHIACHGAFRMLGELLDGKSCRIELSDTQTVMDLEPVSDNFSIGFYTTGETVMDTQVVYIEYAIILTRGSQENGR